MSEPATRGPEGRVRRIAGVALAVLLLHGLTTFRFPWENPPPADGWRPSPDLVALLALGFLGMRFLGTRRWISFAVTFFVGLAVLYRFASTAIPAFYGNALNLYTDASYLPGLWYLLTNEFSFPVRCGIALATVAVAVGLFALLDLVVRAVLRAGARGRRFAPLFAGLTLVLVVVNAFTPAERVKDGHVLFREEMLPALARDLLDLPEIHRQHERYAGRLTEIEEESKTYPRDLTYLDGADVYVYFIESYGRVLLEHPETRARFDAWVVEWERELAEAGIAVRTGYVTPHIKGGQSSLAHFQLLCGLSVANKLHSRMVLDSELVPLPKTLRDVGYRTINAQPVMPIPWPEGQAFYGFTDELFHADYAYRGTRYPWGGMPDQYALAVLLERFVRPAEQPLFALFVSVTSHAPFSHVPPYVEDWSRLLDEETFRVPPAKLYDMDWANFPGHPDAERGYVESIEYSLEVATAFVRELTRPSLVFVLGDHQPPLIGELNEHDSSWDVPMHVLSNRPELLTPFRHLPEGMTPDPEASIRPTSGFLKYFLAGYSKRRGAREPR